MSPLLFEIIKVKTFILSVKFEPELLAGMK